MPHPIPPAESLSVPEVAAVAAQLISAPERRDATDIVAAAYNEVMSDPVIRTSHDAAKYILGALQAAGFAVVEKAEVRS